MIKKILPLIIILLLASFLRLWQLDKLPPGLTWDEAAIGYNAYSILKTARDEHGTFLPLIFKSFGDYKPGLYIYLTVPSVALFGLNGIAVRLPSVIAAIFAVWGIYLLINQLFPKKSPYLGLLSSLLLAVSPWHLHFSRGAWETNLFTTLLLFSIYFFLKSFKKTKFFGLSLILFSLSLFAYQTAKMLSPLVFLLLVSIFHQQIFNQKIKFWSSSRFNIAVFILVALSSAWLYFLTSTGPAGNRLTRLSLFNYRPQPSEHLLKVDNYELKQINLFHSQADLSYRMIISRYLNHFSPEVLFFEGPRISERGHLPRMGMLPLMDAVWIFFGIIALSRNKNISAKLLIFGLLLLAPLPTSLTLSEFSTVRALFMVVPLCLLATLGVVWAINKLPKTITFVLLLGYLITIILGLDLYLHHSSPALAIEFNYGQKQAVEAIKNHPSSRIVFTDVYGQPYIYYLFYSRFDPKEYQELNPFIDQGIDVGKVDKIKNIEFHQFSISDILTQKDTLFIGSSDNVPDNLDYTLPQIVFHQQINAPDGSPVFRIIKTAK